LGNLSDGTNNTNFNIPSCVAVSADGNRIYVADHGNHCIKMFDGKTLAFIGIFEYGFDIHFNSPSGVAVLSTAEGDRIYVADTGNNLVHILSKDGICINTLGNGSDETDNTVFNSPRGVAVSANMGIIYVSDTDKNRIQMFNVITGAFIGTLIIPSNTPYAKFSPREISVSYTGDRIYVADANNSGVHIFELNQQVLKSMMAPIPNEPIANANNVDNLANMMKGTL